MPRAADCADAPLSSASTCAAASSVATDDPASDGTSLMADCGRTNGGVSASAELLGGSCTNDAAWPPPSPSSALPAPPSACCAAVVSPCCGVRSAAPVPGRAGDTATEAYAAAPLAQPSHFLGVTSVAVAPYHEGDTADDGTACPRDGLLSAAPGIALDRRPPLLSSSLNSGGDDCGADDMACGTSSSMLSLDGPSANARLGVRDLDGVWPSSISSSWALDRAPAGAGESTDAATSTDVVASSTAVSRRRCRSTAFSASSCVDRKGLRESAGRMRRQACSTACGAPAPDGTARPRACPAACRWLLALWSAGSGAQPPRPPPAPASHADSPSPPKGTYAQSAQRVK